MISMWASMLMLFVCFTVVNTFAQNKKDSAMMKDCCMMKDGKMMLMKDGKTMPMEKDMTMKNGTKCMVNGECIMSNGKKMKMKEGDCMDMSGKMDHCAMMKESSKNDTKTTHEKHDAAMAYTCPMHPDVISDKPGTCPKCGMDLIEKKKN